MCIRDRHCYDHIVGTNNLVWVTSASSEKQGCNQTTYTSRYMNNSSTGKINGSFCTKVKKESVRSPNPVTERIIYKKTPDSNKKTVCFEINSFSKSPGNQGRCNYCKFSLKHCKNIFGNTCIQNICIDPLQKKVVRIPPKPTPQNVFSETH